MAPDFTEKLPSGLSQHFPFKAQTQVSPADRRFQVSNTAVDHDGQAYTNENLEVQV